jgi:hypothetical protein
MDFLPQNYLFSFLFLTGSLLLPTLVLRKGMIVVATVA